MQSTMTDQEIDKLEDLLASDIFKGEAMTLDYLQGFLCAVISGPDMIPPGVWLPAALGGSREFESNAQAQETIDLVIKFYNSIAATLDSGDELELIIYSQEDNPDELDYAAWCEAYVYGSQIGDTSWIEAAGEFSLDLSEKMEAFFLLSGMLKEDALENNEPWLSRQEEEKAMAMAQEDLPETVSAIFRFWKTQRTPKSPIKRASAKVDRNDPCPCGSGKKYKDCCGKGPTLH